MGENGVKIGEPVNGFCPLAKAFFRFRLQGSVPNFVKIGAKLRARERGQTDRHTHIQTEITQVIL